MSLLYLLAILASLIIYYFVDVKLSSRSINGKSELIWFVLFMLVYFCSKELFEQHDSEAMRERVYHLSALLLPILLFDAVTRLKRWKNRKKQ